MPIISQFYGIIIYMYRHIFEGNFNYICCGFLSLFNGVFPNEIISSAMLLNRGVSFYLYVLLSGIFVSVISIKTKKENKDV